MKKTVVIVILILIFFNGVPSTYKPVKADDGTYLRVITDDTPFYGDSSNSRPLFYLPYTYYVKVLEKNDTLTHVEYCGNADYISLDGFVPTDKLFSDGLEVKNPYPTVTLTTAVTTVLFEDSDMVRPSQYIFAERKLGYFGNITLADGTKAYFVCYNNRLGYIKEESVYPFTLNNHPNELTFIKPDPVIETIAPADGEGDTEGKENNTVIKILIISCLSLAGILALVFAFRKKPTPAPNGGYYDENDYE